MFPATINGVSGTIQHVSLIGQPQLNSSPKEIRLACKYVSTGSSLGTKYRIDYNFKVGYRYYITVNAAQQNSTIGYPTGVYLRLDMTNTGGGGGTCVGAQTISPNYSGNPAPYQFSNASFDDRQFVYASPLTANYSTLEISALPAAATGSDNTIRIKKITIEETAPDVSFTLAPASLEIACGSATPQTFTVANVHSTPGVTAYNWSLGAAYGWLYNGSPAPATIQTSANTLTLTPACQSTHSNISVSVAAGGSSYPANNISTVSTSAPVYIISGSSEICSGSKTYTVNNLPCNGSVSWVSSDPAIAPVTVSNNVATVTRQGTFHDFVTLTATITSSMCHTSPVTVQKKNIAVGFPYFTDTIIGGKRVLPNGIYFYSFRLPLKYPFISSYYWRIPTGWTLMSGQGTSEIKVFTNNSPGTVQLDVTACGVTRGTYIYVAIGGGGPIPAFTDPGTEKELKIFPNPSHHSATIRLSVNDPAAKSGGYVIREIRITDKTGMIRKQYRLNDGRTSETIDISELPPDIYTVTVFDGQSWKQARLSVQ